MSQYDESKEAANMQRVAQDQARGDHTLEGSHAYLAGWMACRHPTMNYDQCMQLIRIGLEEYEHEMRYGQWDYSGAAEETAASQGLDYEYLWDWGIKDQQSLTELIYCYHHDNAAGVAQWQELRAEEIRKEMKAEMDDEKMKEQARLDAAYRNLTGYTWEEPRSS